MSPPRPTTMLRVAYLAVAGVLSVMAVSSYFAYTTAGFDFEVSAGSGVTATYYRLRWDDGSTWVGRAVHPVPRPARALDWFDPGGTLLTRPIRPPHRTRARALGFWWVARPEDDPYVLYCYGEATSSRWAAVPSWLVLLALWGGPMARVVARRRSPDRSEDLAAAIRLAGRGEGR